MSAPCILIVDDTPTNVDAIQGVLQAEGFQTLVACDGPSGRALSRTEKPDLILLDVMMPGENGFETCSRLKSDPSTADIPIIFLSALDDVKNKVIGLRAGGVDYLSKPVHGEEVLARVRVHLRIRENGRALIREHRARLEELREAQQSILVRPEECPEAHFAVYYEPLEEAGGDFYDVLAVDSDVFGYFVADVSGHGASAAFLTSAIKALLRQYAGPVFSPEETMRGVDAVMRHLLGAEQYVTACYARLNRRTKRLTVVSAGHPPLILVRHCGTVKTVEMDTSPLGIFSSLVLQRKDLTVAEGDRFYLYSDGMIESSPGGGRRGGTDRLSKACAEASGVELAEAVRTIAAAVRPKPGAATDDLLLLGGEVCR
jgi:sigma-B regulation protein RsbU (phosphoserine phosphatase)